jgi:hypothetical protein
MTISSEEMKQTFEKCVADTRANPPQRRGKRVPYVLFGAIQKNMDKNNQMQDVCNVIVFPMNNCHCNKSTIDYYVLGKNFTVLDYWFPGLDKNTIERFHDGKNPYVEVSEHLSKLKQLSPATQQAQKAEIDAMAQKIAMLEGKLKK